MITPDNKVDRPSEHLLVVRDPDGLHRVLSERYAGWEVTSAESYLSGIVALNRLPARAVLVGVDPACRRLPAVVAGLRDVCGPQARVVLCCEPACEPLARQAIEAGADDYVIHPPTGEELDKALGIPPTMSAGASPGPGAADVAELDAVGTLLGLVGNAMGPFLQTLARHLQRCLRAGGVRVTADRVTGQAGGTDGSPVLAEPLCREGTTVGQIELWPPTGEPFLPADAERLRHYARLAERMLGLAEREQHWRRLALTDDLTGLPNRRFLFEFLDDLLARAAAERRRITLLMFDIDDFKSYNDRYGHPVGDQIIRETGQLFRQHCRQHDVVTRYGGDEFAVVFWDAEGPRVAGSQHPDSPLEVLRRFRAALERHEFPSLGAEAQGTLTISGGLAGYPWDARTRDELIARADDALLTAKAQGKNRIHLIGSE